MLFYSGIKIFLEFLFGCDNQELYSLSTKMLLSVFGFEMDTVKVREAFIDTFLKNLTSQLDKHSNSNSNSNNNNTTQDGANDPEFAARKSKAIKRSLVILIVK